MVLEGGGVKGIGLVGALSALEEAGYRPRRIAGTSAGAIVGALTAAGMPPDRMRALLDEVSLRDFADPDLIGRLGAPGRALSLFLHSGLYRGRALRDWLAEQLASLGVRTFGDLRDGSDADDARPPALRHRLVVMVADVSRGRLVRLPWDYPEYGLDPDRQSVADAVRASAAIPFFYRPVRLRHAPSGEEVYLVDGGLLSNFPVDVFDRRDGRPPRFPTFGIKLSARPEAPQVPQPIRNTLGYGRAIVSTLLSAQEQRYLDDPCVVARTIFVDTMRVRSTDFDVDRATRDALWEQGGEAVARFLASWDFARYLASCPP